MSILHPIRTLKDSLSAHSHSKRVKNAIREGEFPQQPSFQFSEADCYQTQDKLLVDFRKTHNILEFHGTGPKPAFQDSVTQGKRLNAAVPATTVWQTGPDGKKTELQCLVRENPDRELASKALHVNLEGSVIRAESPRGFCEIDLNAGTTYQVETTVIGNSHVPRALKDYDIKTGRVLDESVSPHSYRFLSVNKDGLVNYPRLPSYLFRVEGRSGRLGYCDEIGRPRQCLSEIPLTLMADAKDLRTAEGLLQRHHSKEAFPLPIPVYAAFCEPDYADLGYMSGRGYGCD